MGDYFLPPAALSFLFVVLTGILVMSISVALRWFWAQAVSLRGLYYIINAPGVVVHEITHVIGCLITGAKIKKVVLFSTEGGSVTYASPRIPLFGNVIINTAPLIGILLVLAGLTWIFGTYLGCTFFSSVPSLTSVAGAGSLVTTAITIFYQNLVVKFNGWFLLYLYLTVSLVLSLSPSMQDIRNAMLGLLVLIILGLLIIASNVSIAITFLGEVMALFATGLALGLLFELIALMVTVPIAAVYALKHG